MYITGVFFPFTSMCLFCVEKQLGTTVQEIIRQKDNQIEQLTLELESKQKQVRFILNGCTHSFPFAADARALA